MNVLFIAPLPPPTTGHSLAAAVLAEDLARTDVVDIVNLGVDSAHDGSVSAKRLRAVGSVLWAVARRVRRADVVYLTISESLAGNLKDLCIYLLCTGRLRRTFIHLHGGSIGRMLFEPRPAARWLNARAIRRLGGVIICGASHESIFRGMVARERLHIIPNFALDEFFADDASVEAKFRASGPIRVLYMSGMTRPKGYAALLDAYESLDADVQAQIRLDFAGRFDDPREEAAFEARLAPLVGARYHGFVDGDAKRRLLVDAHVFCLPSTMLEGQPIALLEAYAAGCVVLATGQPGIRDVFRDGENGYELEPASAASIAAAMAAVVADRANASRLARHNHHEARARFRRGRFTGDVMAVLRGCAATPAPLTGAGAIVPR